MSSYARDIVKSEFVTKLTLLPHQIVGRDFLVSHDRALLADGPRVGKSIQTIAAVDELRADKVLIECPASLRTQWRRQFATYAKHHPGYLKVVSPEEAIRDQKKLMAEKWDVFPPDECHFFKSRKSKRTQVLYGTKCDGDGLISTAARVWPLSGTPSPNNASELWPMLRALFPETIQHQNKSLTYWQFVTKFCRVEVTPFGTKIVGNKNTDELKKRMAPIMLRRPSSILGNVVLPPETLYLDVAQKELDRLQEELRAELGEAKGFDLNRVSIETLDNLVRARMSRLTGLAKVPALAERIETELESGLDKVVVFAWHKDVIGSLREKMEDLYGKGGVEWVTGESSMERRSGAVDRFQTDANCRVFIGNIKAAGVGLDLSAACELIFAETSWVPGDNEQAAMRITGVNQKRAVRVRYAVLPGSLDERLTEVNRRKSADIAELFG